MWGFRGFGVGFPRGEGLAAPPRDMPAAMPDTPVPKEGHPALPEGPHAANSHGRERLPAQPSP